MTIREPAIAKLINHSSRDTAELLDILGFAAEKIGGLDQGRIAVKVKDGNGNGHAADATMHRTPRWAHPHRYAVYLTIPTDAMGDAAEIFGRPRACWHSKAARDLANKVGTPLVYETWALAYEAGERRYGRWPIYTINDWREHLVQLAAHEFAHILAYDRERTRGRASEVQCELFAERVLNEWRLENTNREETMTIALPPTITIAKMGQDTWHVLAGHVTDDIMKTACGIRATPVTVESGIDGRAVRHRGANICANCRVQLAHNEGGTMSSTMTDTLHKQAGKAATAAPKAEPASGDGKATATATRPRTRRQAGKSKLSALKAAEQILREEGKPLHVKELTERIQAMPNTKLGGKTPDATVGAILAVNIKKSGTVFRRTKPGTYAIRKGR